MRDRNELIEELISATTSLLAKQPAHELGGFCFCDLCLAIRRTTTAIDKLAHDDFPGDAMRDRIKYDHKGDLDEVVMTGVIHLERMDARKWFLACTRADGSELAIWINGRIAMVEERPPPQCLPTSDNIKAWAHMRAFALHEHEACAIRLAAAAAVFDVPAPSEDETDAALAALHGHVESTEAALMEAYATGQRDARTHDEFPEVMR